MYGTDVIYFDSDPEQLDAIAPTQPHRNVDLTVVAGDKEGIARPAWGFVPELTWERRLRQDIHRAPLDNLRTRLGASGGRRSR